MNRTSHSFSISEKIIYAIVAVITLYLLGIVALPKLIVSKAVYGDYYWFRAPWLFIHVFTGLLATFIGWSQFVPNCRVKYLKLHRKLGIIYVISILIASTTALYLAVYSPGVDIIGKISFGVVSLIWLSTVIFAYFAIIRKNIVQHQEWMIRSYVVTFFFTIFVIITKYLPYEYLGTTYTDAMPLITWVSWAIPLFITELVIQGKKIF